MQDVELATAMGMHIAREMVYPICKFLSLNHLVLFFSGPALLRGSPSILVGGVAFCCTLQGTEPAEGGHVSGGNGVNELAATLLHWFT